MLRAEVYIVFIIKGQQGRAKRKMVAQNTPLLLGTVLVLGLLSAGSAKAKDDAIAIQAFEEERYQDIVKQVPDEIGIDPKDAYEAEMRLASLENFSNTGVGVDGSTVGGDMDVSDRRLRALTGISDSSTATAATGATARNLGGKKSESKRKKSLFKKESSSKSKSKKKKDSDDSESSESKSKKKSQSKKKSSPSSSTDDKSMKRKKRSDSSTDGESKSKTEIDQEERQQ